MISRPPRLLETSGRDELALVHVLQLDDDPLHVVETVDSIDPRYPRQQKSVIILSTQFGCPVGCLMCEAGGAFLGNLSAQQMLSQVQFVLLRRPEVLRTRKLKVHFARMGEPALNRAVLEALERLPALAPSPGLMACISSVAPAGSEPFFEELIRIKERCYAGGQFQLQLSINSTDPTVRRRMIPIPHLGLEAIARLGGRFFRPGDRKVALNFALARGFPVDPQVLAKLFDPAQFMIKLTPVNPTERSRLHGLDTVLSAATAGATDELAGQLAAAGFDAIVSIGEPEEIAIGSNCGQLVRAQQAARSVDQPLRRPGRSAGARTCT